ncbi:MAG: elongation factor G [Candidatus Omnitrophica bacterium CG12_big_fil_rev_8_21_14_0_65_43_15]|uniref:Elongation factor G n=1 Tax=Candidatus Taenaricola geysiri TaxID=1974752 RepID=A0A2J0LNT3_9BACT|nr:MAG: elongation factor G [Candidatus Omnitrophica bacterium CG12_big_fil_rev_8_21_14_0_65_43_15]PIY84788.1 MAG: elongation factor G [Candidatus Omnitrophica bacterium CG_4_10_14_0_8_um_filter_43_18]
MPDYDTDHIRNIVLLSHPQAGKTSVSEAMLFAAGAVSRQGKIDDGSTTSDYLADEIERKGSINLGVLNCMWKSHKINIIDTPGYAEFINDVITAQIAADIAIIVVDAASGIELGTERAWKIISEKRLPALIYINKMDRERADFHKTYEAIVNKFGNKCVVLVAPEGKVLDKKAGEKYYQQLVDTVAEVDDKLVEKYLESGELSPDEIISALKKGVLEGSVIPVVCGSATTNPQADILLDIITEFFPCPSYKTEIKGKTPSSGAEEARKISDTEHFSGQVFKTVVDPYVGQLSIFKIFSGKLMPDTSFYNVSRGASERIGKIFYIQGKSQAPVAKAIAGDIVAVAKLKDTHTGDSISEDKSQILFDPPVFPEPAMSFAVKPKSRADEDKISGALTKLALEDLTFKVNRDPQTKEMIVSGLGDLHLKIMLHRLKLRFGVDVEVGTPKIAYKETIVGKGDAQYRHKKQSGGAGQFAEVWLKVEPMERGKGFEFVDDIVGGAIPGPFVVSCEKGIRSAMDQGPLAGYPVVDVRAIVYDGKTHPVDSKDIAFQIAAKHGFKDAFLKARPVLLEPIMDIEVTVPDEFMGDVSGMINSKRGRILGVNPSGIGSETVAANVPLAEMFKFISELKSLTGGRGSYTMHFNRYEEVPGKFAQAIIDQAKATRQEEKEE